MVAASNAWAKMHQLDWRARSVTRRVILHSAPIPPTASAVNYLLTRGRAMGLLSVGYHFVIERDGRVWRCRPEEAIGSHTPANNHDSLGVFVAGGEGGKDDFTFDQMQAVFQLCLYLSAAYPGVSIVGHSEVQRYRNHKHECPSFDVNVHVRHRIEQFRRSNDLSEPHEPPTAAQPNASTEQHRILLDVLKQGRSLTTQIALVNFGIGSLSSRIAELRAAGHKITDEWGTDYHGKRYKKYRMEGANA